MTTIPNPGSSEAVELGCCCAVLDNAHGDGVPLTLRLGDEGAAFWICGACPIHSPSDSDLEAAGQRSLLDGEA